MPADRAVRDRAPRHDARRWSARTTAPRYCSAVARPAGAAQQAGFTLVELLVAAAVFAVLGVLAAQLLFETSRSHDFTNERSLRLGDVQRAMQIMQRDVLQLAFRPVRDELGDRIPELIIGDFRPIEFTRYGWRNPQALPRSNLQRVAYVLEDGNLYRFYWNVLDRAETSEPIRQALLEDVDTLEITAIDVSGNVHSFWPLIGEVADDPNAALAAISFRLTVAPFGELVRIWDVPDDPTAPQRGQIGQPGQPGQPGQEDDLQ